MPAFTWVLSYECNNGKAKCSPVASQPSQVGTSGLPSEQRLGGMWSVPGLWRVYFSRTGSWFKLLPNPCPVVGLPWMSL